MRSGSGMNHWLASSSGSISGCLPLTSLTGIEESCRKGGGSGGDCSR